LTFIVLYFIVTYTAGMPKLKNVADPGNLLTNQWYCVGGKICFSLSWNNL